MRLIRDFILSHPWNSAMLVVLLLLAGLAGGLGLSAMMPMLNLAFDSGAGAGAAAGTGAPAIAPGAAPAGKAADVASEDNLTALVYKVIEAAGLTPSLGVLLCMIVAGITFKSLLVFIAEQRIGYLAADVATGLRVQLLRAITASSWRFYVNQSVGRLANSMATEAWRASNAYVYAIRLTVVFIETLVYFSIALLVSWQATLICLIAGLAVWGISHQFVKISKYAGTGQTNWYRSLLGSLTDILQSIKTLKSMGRERAAESLVARETLELKADLRREVLGNAGLDAAQEPLYTLVIVIGVYLALVKFSVELATVTFLTLVLARLLKRGSKVQKEYQRMITSESAFWSLQQTVAEAEREAEINTGTRQPSLDRHIRLDDVSFTYGDTSVLSGVSLEIPAGEMTCLVGESGTGKSTVADLIIGLMRPTAGRVMIDDVALDDLDLTAWRRSIGYVPQDNLLLHDSVFANVALGDEQLTAAEAARALQAAGAEAFVDALPQGMHTIVGERGARLSGGQRQRIMIARALAHGPRLLILDEATSALDAASEAAICGTLASLKGRITILAVTHQSALQRVADRVYRLHDGRLTRLEGHPAATGARWRAPAQHAATGAD